MQLRLSGANKGNSNSLPVLAPFQGIDTARVAHQLLFEPQPMDVLGRGLQPVPECLLEAHICPVVDQISCVHNFRRIKFSLHDLFRPNI